MPENDYEYRVNEKTPSSRHRFATTLSPMILANKRYHYAS
jgi:hypothetical protein